MKNNSLNTAVYSSLPHGKGTPRATVLKSKRNDSYILIRLLDILISFVALIFLAPAFALIAFLVKIQDRGPVFFGQTRIGLNTVEFKCYKFRSMVLNSDEVLKQLLTTDPVAYREWQADHKLRNDPRITRIGKFLRKTSLDELPQLYNVLVGEMSLVGPRPIIHSEIVKYGRSFKKYASVLPGVTGLWQVSGRNDVSYRRRVALDRLFAKRKSVKLYFYILFMTIPAILLQKGSY
jgi:exopolysaccharide production protein ExoY